jgi:predicted flap endonuclease-1-like 5' DNA nuclease
MRSDYVLYVVAIIFFIITAAVATYAVTQQLWIVTTAVIGLAFIGLGYSQRPKQVTAPVTTNVPSPPPSPPQQQQQQETPVMPTAPPQPTTTDVVKHEEATPIVQAPQPLASVLTKVRGIGEKRAAQLKALGINSIEDLATASAKDLATKLDISPKITTKWIENAKEIGQKK